MPTLRLPLAEQFTNRDSTNDKDARLTNCYIRNIGGAPVVVKRPGITSYSSNTVGQGQGMSYFGDSLYSISGGVLTRNKAGVITTYALAAGSLIYDFSSSVLANLLVFKSSANFYTFDPTTLTLSHITVNYPTTTVRGLVYLDGYFFVAEANGRIHNSGIEDPATWAALDYISAEIESDNLMAIGKVLNNLVALGTRTTEFFYDAANINGSPLSSVSNAFSEIGCASGDSVQSTGNQLIWVMQGKQRGRQVVLLDGFVPQVVSTPEVEIYINADTLDPIYSYIFKIAGSTFYTLTMETTNITLVYDLQTKVWWNASSMHFGSSGYPQSIVSEGGGTTVFQYNAHGLVQGDSVFLSGVIPTTGNGSYPIKYIDANHFSVFFSGTMNPIVPTYTTAVPSDALPGYAIPSLTNVQITTYKEGYVQNTYYATDGFSDFLQGENDGKIYTISPTVYTDDGTFINMVIRTTRQDMGNTKRKFLSRLELIADKIDAKAYVRYSDDDYATWTPTTPINMLATRSLVLRLGQFRKRAFELRFPDPKPFRVGGLEMDVEQGTS